MSKTEYAKLDSAACGTYPIAVSRSTRPSRNGVSPAIHRSSVVLPWPLGPRIDVMPPSIRRFACRNTQSRRG